MSLLRKALSLAFLLIALSGCKELSNTDLYSGFTDPPAEARPFVRWWWNGNRITGKEIIRQLDVMKDAGLGGVEINPIAMPPEGDTTGTTALKWLSPEWNNLLALASREASSRGMITDLIVGSGWPFGGEFLRKDEAIQRVMISSIDCNGGDLIDESLSNLVIRALGSQPRSPEGESFSKELLFIRLVPDEMESLNEVKDISGFMGDDQVLSFKVPEGKWNIIYGILEKGHRFVQNGAPGAAGPVMDHYKKEVTISYLNRLKKISEDTGIPLKKLIRALFCDSIELAGSNWTDGMAEEFLKRYGYNLEPYFPFIFYESYRGYNKENYSKEIRDLLRRVRYDYNEFLVSLFLENFTAAFQEFCTENGVLCRYQAYGTPFLMGIMEGNMIPDIPESNNWLFSGNNMYSEEWTWNQDHGYMIWNHYAASGGHLMGRKIISCESMTNTRGVWKASLADIKRHDDMNFISGMNHSVLHGYNYSPVEAGFPGWIKFGEYFSEQNTFWPWFRKWSDYNSRLSYIFQQLKPEKKIAILGPTGDIWSEKGLSRNPFHVTPGYCYRLWEPISQTGYSCDYISEKIVIDAKSGNGRISYGPMSYEAIILCSITSMKPAAALALKNFSSSGGKIIIIGDLPSRSLSMNDPGKQDSIVSEIFHSLSSAGSLIRIPEPGPGENLISFISGILSKAGIDPDVEIENPSPNLFQIRNSFGDKEIYFFVNPNLVKSAISTVKFPTGNKIPWIWNPEDGTRSVYPSDNSKSEFTINLGPLESLLLVFDSENGNPKKIDGLCTDTLLIDGSWEALFRHKNGTEFTRSFVELNEFGTSVDDELSSFAGTVNYLTEFESDGTGKYIIIENVNRGITELMINGKSAGVNWYGKARFNVEGMLIPGKNKLELRHTTLLANYVSTLKENPTAVRWSSGYTKIPCGIDGPVMIIK